MLPCQLHTSRIHVHTNTANTSRCVRIACQPRTEAQTAAPAKQLDPALLARLEKAKAYKKGLQRSNLESNSDSAAVSLRPPTNLSTKPAAEESSAVVGVPLAPSNDLQQPSSAGIQVNEDGSPNAISLPNAVVDQDGFASYETRSSNRGNSKEAAYWLQSVLKEREGEQLDGLDASKMRPEEYTRLKEARTRATQQVEIITVDKSYKPKVSTWGVFPRPDNISSTFGGGRNIEPGQELETEEETKARRARTDALLEEYKRKAGTLVDPEVEKECEALFQEADAMFRAGLLQAAYNKYDIITKKVVVKSRIGGFATLQKAITLDSLGYNKEAQPLYKSLAMHPNPLISKKAKQMLFGFDAATFLKADTIDFSGKKKAWAKYFTRNSAYVYVQSEEEREKDAAAMRAASAVAVAVMVGPFAAIAVAAMSK